LTIFFVRFLQAFAGCWAAYHLTSPAQAAPTAQFSGWQISGILSEESVGQGLPVLALAQDDWYQYLPNPIRDGRAVRSMTAQLLATHPSGWRLAAVSRAQAWIEANADAIAVAALELQSTSPSVPRKFEINASSQSWSGDGILLGTPWWPISAATQWQWQADLTLLNLTQLRLANASGTVHYRGDGAYGFNLRSQRSNTGITGRFLAASGSAGSGASVSLALQGQPLPGWQVALRADDVASSLQWIDLATDANTLASANTTRRPDGYLDYGPYLQGRKTLQSITAHIAPRWQLTLQHALTADNSPGAALTWEMLRQAGINQTWLGWRSDPPTSNLPHLSLALEPNWPALKLQATWHGWRLMLATDGKGVGTHYRSLELGWQTEF
jgi:hypothetical protein